MLHFDPAAVLVSDDQRLIEQFLYFEASLLDQQRFEDWLELFAEDLRYWAPVRFNRLYREQSGEMAAEGESSYFNESLEQLALRVARLRTRMAWAEDPPSRTRHVVTNVRCAATDVADELAVESNFIVYRSRLERDTDYWVGARYDVIRRTPERSSGFSIARRKVVLDASVLLSKNISVFF